MKRMFGFIGIIVGTQFIVSSAIAGTTWVSGVISTNTVWDTTGSPYIVTGDVLIDSAVTLDIEPGVEVRIDSVKRIMIKGTLNAIGTATDSIIITRNGTARWSRLWFKPASAGSLKYCRIEYAGNSAIFDSTASSLVIEYNTITNDSAYYGGGICSWYGLPVISNNTIMNNLAFHSGGGIFSYHGSPTISDNIIMSDSAYQQGGGIYSAYGSSRITGNTITANSAYGWGGGICGFHDSLTISNNTITGNSANAGGSIWSAGSPTIKYNTISDTTASAIYIANSDSAWIDSNNLYATGYAVYNNSSDSIDARHNYWGTASNDTIDMKIWDFCDASTKGIVYYEPFLTEPLEFGIEEREKLRVESLELRVYPNPSTTGVRVQWSGVSEGQKVSLKVYDLGGRLVKTVLTTKQGVEINLEELTNGIYFMRVEVHTGLVTSNFKATKKIVLMR